MNAKIVNVACNAALTGGILGLILVIAMPVFGVIGAAILPASQFEAIVKALQSDVLMSIWSRPVLFVAICAGLTAWSWGFCYWWLGVQVRASIEQSKGEKEVKGHG